MVIDTHVADSQGRLLTHSVAGSQRWLLTHYVAGLQGPLLTHSALLHEVGY